MHPIVKTVVLLLETLVVEDFQSMGEKFFCSYAAVCITTLRYCARRSCKHTNATTAAAAKPEMFKNRIQCAGLSFEHACAASACSWICWEWEPVTAYSRGQMNLSG